MHSPIHSSSDTHNLFEITQASIYLMGISFVLGSLFTMFVLLVLDYLRRANNNQHSAEGFASDSEP